MKHALVLTFATKGAAKEAMKALSITDKFIANNQAFQFEGLEILEVPSEQQQYSGEDETVPGSTPGIRTASILAGYSKTKGRSSDTGTLPAIVE
jgi:hypothetical protein